jgi:hypothetical protein|tara:strand:+ start:438 stop:647 length:210 start_codon:yes stop_codon:yes gene_type:complete
MSNGILNNQLPNSALGLQGQTPPLRAGALKTSTLHNQSSINNEPAIEQSPSDLDLNGNTPDKYLDNPPQ